MREKDYDDDTWQQIFGNQWQDLIDYTESEAVEEDDYGDTLLLLLVVIMVLSLGPRGRLDCLSREGEIALCGDSRYELLRCVMTPTLPIYSCVMKFCWQLTVKVDESKRPVDGSNDMVVVIFEGSEILSSMLIFVQKLTNRLQIFISIVNLFHSLDDSVRG
ncbi:hypothetical protein BDA99DRAFT_534216 [Phascolomyces articulosus]|uniref:Uncharacterized protein n=1 Tax=Phascolomyces articulosus TaxID=60185 RepID=A0AAD5K6K6_9FUNG|nr:hypothetical protein BDA99DRAFT_534216 [Phascolomyces articulosus]